MIASGPKYILLNVGRMGPLRLGVPLSLSIGFGADQVSDLFVLYRLAFRSLHGLLSFEL